MAHAFYEGCKIDYYRMIDLFLHRYGGIDALLPMPFIDFVRLHNVAQEEKIREENYLAWVQLYPHMDKKSFISFDDFNAKATGKIIDTRPSEDILAEVAEIRRKVKENG